MATEICHGDTEGPYVLDCKIMDVTEYDKEVARHLGMPVAIIMSIRRNEWGAVRNYAQRRWNADGFAALKANWNAVERILNEFSNLVQNSVPVNFEQKKRIAIYTKHIGVALLIDDMREAVSKNPRIRSINYFLNDHDGQTARWGMLYFRVIEDNHNRLKNESRNLDERLAAATGFAVKKDAPQWVIDAENRKAELRAGNSPSDSERQELRTIEARLFNHYQKQ